MWMPDPNILSEIYTFGQKRGWQIELCGRRPPPGWVGDGILADYLQPDELRKIRNFNRTPVVCRELHSEKNVRTVSCNTRILAEMIADYFQNKGFIHYAAIDAREWPGDYHGFWQDPIRTLAVVLGERGLKLERGYWNPGQRSDELTNYSVVLRTLRRFFRELPKPAALMIPNSLHLTVAYRALAAESIKVPEEIAVICTSDNALLTDNAMIPTTRISGEMREIGRKMAELLDRMLRGEDVPAEPVCVTPATIISRRSTDVLAVQDVRLATAINFLLTNYMNFISVEDAACAAGISSATLTRKFQRYLGKTSLRFLFELRINRIRELLDDTDLSLPEIAERTGYGSNMALSLAFKRETGVTPGTYRLSRRRMQQT